jgi:hypothetical protein
MCTAATLGPVGTTRKGCAELGLPLYSGSARTRIVRSNFADFPLALLTWRLKGTWKGSTRNPARGTAGRWGQESPPI